MFGLFKSLLGNDAGDKTPIKLNKYVGVSFIAPDDFMEFITVKSDEFQRLVWDYDTSGCFRVIINQLNSCTSYETCELMSLILKLQESLKNVAFSYSLDNGISVVEIDDGYSLAISLEDIEEMSELYEYISVLDENTDKFLKVSNLAYKNACYLADKGSELRRMMESIIISALSIDYKDNLDDYVINIESSYNPDLYDDSLMTTLL